MNVAYTYTSSAAAVATVSSTGVVTAVAPGVASITISATGTGTGLASASLSTATAITVSDRTPGLTTLQVSPTAAALLTGGTQQVTATAQGPRASAATITYGTSAPAIATVSATGLITAVAPGTATITVTAQATQDGAFAASSITGLVTVTVTAPAQVTVSLSDITQGPTVTSYSATATSGGIVSAANAQVGLAVDAANVRDQIQVVGTLAANGARVDSVVVYLADATGANRVSAARQAFANGVASSGNLTFFVNTADFTADFAAGTAAVRFTNGQRQISISAWSGATEVRAAATQTLALNNVDGYAARLTAPARSATNATSGLLYHGGPDSLTASLGSATIVPVFYTAGRTLARATLSMRQGALGDTQVCSTARNNLAAAPFVARFGGAAASAGDTTLVNCSALESDAAHIIGITAATDNAGTAAPITTYAAGFRTSATVTAPTALRLDYVAPTATAIARPDSGWVNGAYRFDTLTAPSTDLGVGFAGTTNATRRSARVWGYRGCGVGSAAVGTTPAVFVTFSGSANDIAECLSSTSAAAYTLQYTDADRLGNAVTSATATVGVDKTAPLIAWDLSDVADSTIGAATYVPTVLDARSGISDSVTALTPNGSGVYGFVARYGLGQWDGTVATSGRRCRTLDGTNPLVAGVATVTAAGSTLSCSAYAFAAGRLGPAQATTNYRPLVTGAGATVLSIASAANQNMVASVTVIDRAGNSATSTRRAMQDNTAPASVTSGLGSSAITAATNPAFQLNFQDQRIGWGRINLTYNSIAYRYPAATLGTAFGSAYTGVLANVTAAALAPQSATISTPMGAPFMVAVQTSTTTFGYLAEVGGRAVDVAGNGTNATAEAINGASVPNLGTPAAAQGALNVLTSLNAAGGASAGLKAQLTGNALTSVNPFSRVDFYRESANNTFDYIGSTTTAVSSTSATTGLPVWTFLSGPMPAVSPDNTPSVAVGTGDKIRAIGVSANGAGVVSTDIIIGGPSIRVSVSGLPTGAPATITVSRGTFSQSITATNVAGAQQDYVVGVPETGVYTVTSTADVSAAGVLYALTTNNPLSVTVVGEAQVTATVTYGMQAFRAAVTVTNLPNGGSANLTFRKTGANDVIAPVVNGVNNITLPSGGQWTILAGTHTTTTGLTYVEGTVLTGTFATASSSATVTGTGSTLTADGVVAADTLILNGSTLGVIAGGGVDNANGTLTLATALGATSTAATANAKLVRRPASATVTPVVGANATAASRQLNYVNTTPYRTWTWTLPTGVTPVTKLFYRTTDNTVTDSATTIPAAGGIHTVSATRSNGAQTTANYSQLRIDPVTVDGITYGNSAFSAAANIGAPQLAGNGIAVGYFAARLATAFLNGTDAVCNAGIDASKNATVAALEGLGITLTVNGPTATPVTIQRTISGTAVNTTLAVEGAYAIAQPANMVVGGVTYRLIPQGVVNVPYQSAVTTRNIYVCLP